MLALFQQEFVRNAFLAGTIVAVVTAVIGYFVILRAQAFAGEALADIGFAGATGAAVLGISSLLGMFFLALLAALGMGALGTRIRGRDVEIGMVLSFALGLGALFLSIYSQSGTNASAGVGILFGSILSVTLIDVLISLASGIATLLVIAFLFRPLLFASVDPEVAEARGVPVRLLSIISPAATAMHLTRRPLTSISLAVALGLIFTWGGLILAFVGTGRNLPVSFYITTLAALSYFISIPLGRLLSPRPEMEQPYSSCKQVSAPLH